MKDSDMKITEIWNLSGSRSATQSNLCIMKIFEPFVNSSGSLDSLRCANASYRMLTVLQPEVHRYIILKKRKTIESKP
jgi:hypothetical protein